MDILDIKQPGPTYHLELQNSNGWQPYTPMKYTNLNSLEDLKAHVIECASHVGWAPRRIVETIPGTPFHYLLTDTRGRTTKFVAGSDRLLIKLMTDSREFFKVAIVPGTDPVIRYHYYTPATWRTE